MKAAILVKHGPPGGMQTLISNPEIMEQIAKEKHTVIKPIKVSMTVEVLSAV